MKKVIAVLSIVFLSACTAKQAGKIVGGSVGGFVGSKVGKTVAGDLGKVVGAGLGAYVGSFAGGELFDSLSKVSQDKTQKTAEDLLETGVDGDVGVWENGEESGEFKIEETKYITELQTVCRDFTQTTTHKGQTETVKGTACRDPETGKWKFKS